VSIVGYKGRNHPQQVARNGTLDEVDDRGTPDDFFQPLNERHHFTLDVAAAHHNAKCERYYTRADDGLSNPWTGQSVWCNPPYSAIGAWVTKAWTEAGTCDGIVMLLPANRTEQRWWQDLVEPHRDRPESPLTVEFLAGRLRFIQHGATEIKPNERPPFGCCLLRWASFSPYRIDLGLTLPGI
jgi:phage N-6-adenine-methyltransferase